VPIDLPDDLTSTLQEGRQAYIAVPSKHGPHVTPELYTWSDGKLWFASATTTLKAKVLDREGCGGVLVTSAGRSVVLTGPVAAYDPRDVRSIASTLRSLPSVARASGSFVTRNASDLLAFVGDTARGRLGRKPPPMRVLFALDPDRAAGVENDRLTGAWGGWSGPDLADDTMVPAGGSAAVLAVPGPVPLPARWFEDDKECFVAPDLLAMLDLDDRIPIGLVTDEYHRPGPAAKAGALLRGEATIGDRPGVVKVDAERLVEWDGVETSSRSADEL
jgi:hypothetical protein